LKRDMKATLTVPEYYRKLGNEILTLDTITTKDWTEDYRKMLRDEHYWYADKVEKEEQESLTWYKRRNYKKGKR